MFVLAHLYMSCLIHERCTENGQWPPVIFGSTVCSIEYCTENIHGELRLLGLLKSDSMYYIANTVQTGWRNYCCTCRIGSTECG